ncbi:MAG: ParB N-terminal domain-containing protein [Erysipelotrichaceae bacterium]
MKYIEIEKIKYTPCSYSSELTQSLKEKGILVSLRVNKTNDGYQCIDGHKRLSCINLEKLAIKEVSAVIVNDHSKQGSRYWGAKNTH